eukprot:TRINITY_DN869_c0_g2_i2.p1 TRINITY_DN869_c0_g2~~TRINITY_DN869_c0_g2_i2.p1  ORF type:complete len:110 (+),score=11.00 TRINITY_DN869_c0_g2_i2:53-382(+)
MYTVPTHAMSDLDLTACDAPASPRLKPIKKVFLDDSLDLGSVNSMGYEPVSRGQKGSDLTLLTWLRRQSKYGGGKFKETSRSMSLSPSTTTLSSSDMSFNSETLSLTSE